MIVALVMRLWELAGRTMHYDEAIHLHTAWNLATGKEFIHAPWMHGPFQVEFTALIFLVVGDSDFTARIGYASSAPPWWAYPTSFATTLGGLGHY